MRLIDIARRRIAQYADVDAVRIAPARGVLSISFDDFPETAWTEAGPILAERGVKATYFVCGGLEGGRNLDLPQFRTDHLLALAEAGHEVGCHTFSHLSAMRAGPEAYRRDIEANARWVSDRLGRAMTTFAYPFGHVTLGTKRVVRARFDTARGVRNGVNAHQADRALTQSIGLERRRLPGYDLEALAALTADARGWLIAYGHDVSDRPSPYGCRPEDLVRLIDLARQAGLDIVPVGEAFARLGSQAPH